MHILLAVIVVAALVSLASVKPGRRALRPGFVWALLGTIIGGVLLYYAASAFSDALPTAAAPVPTAEDLARRDALMARNAQLRAHEAEPGSFRAPRP